MVYIHNKGGESMGQVLMKEKYSEQINYLDILHSDSKGWITKAEINCGYKQWHYRYNELLEQDFNQENVYISINMLQIFIKNVTFV